MTTIRLGTGADAIEVEDGASVPLVDAIDMRANVHLIDGLCCLRWGVPGGQVVCSFDPRNGTLHSNSWSTVTIDLDALRRERAPKHHGAWVLATEREAGKPMLHAAIKGSPIADYWTWRPFNTPEKQAAFDAAMNGWLCDLDTTGMSTRFQQLMDAARALGYGRKR